MFGIKSKSGHFRGLKTNIFQEEANTVLLEARLWDSNQTTKRNRLDISQGREGWSAGVSEP